MYGLVPIIRKLLQVIEAEPNMSDSPARRGKESFAGVYGAVEAGGTKFVCAVGAPGGDIVAQVSLPTTAPEETLAGVAEFFAAARARHGAVAAVGIGSFGPVHVRPDAAQYGRIARTPKLRWQGVDILGEFSRAAAAPGVIDTDVNAALLGEARHGAGVG
jgi:fructokinase